MSVDFFTVFDSIIKILLFRFQIKSKVISDEVPIETRQAAPAEEFCLPNTILSMIYDNKDPYENGLTEGKIHCDRNKVKFLYLRTIKRFIIRIAARHIF